MALVISNRDDRSEDKVSEFGSESMKPISFICQYTGFHNPILQKVGCGLSCVAMVLREEGKISVDDNLDSLAAKVLVDHRNGGVEMVILDQNLNGSVVPVTIGRFNGQRLNVGEYIETGNQDDFHPVFTVEKGYDHRGSKDTFAKWKLCADILEGVDVNDIVKLFRSGKAMYFMASIRWNTSNRHIVLIYNISSCLSDCVKIRYLDSAKKNYQKGDMTLPASEFAKIFNGFGTVVYT